MTGERYQFEEFSDYGKYPDIAVPQDNDSGLDDNTRYGQDPESLTGASAADDDSTLVDESDGTDHIGELEPTTDPGAIHELDSDGATEELGLSPEPGALGAGDPGAIDSGSLFAGKFGI